MTPNRTAPPVARRLAERPAAPPLPPAVLVGDDVAEERLLLREESRLLAEDTREEILLETPERIEERLEVGNELTEEARRKTMSTYRKFEKGDATYWYRKGNSGYPGQSEPLQGYSWPQDMPQPLTGTRCLCKRR